MKKALFCCLAPLLLVAAPAADPQRAGMDPRRLALIAQRMNEFERRGELAGTVTLLQRHGAMAHFAATGWADVEARKPMRLDTIFQIMSMTKPFTGICVMLLAEEGKLRINDSVERYLPEFHAQKMIAGTGANADMRIPLRPITIRDLMTHTSGVIADPPTSTGPITIKMDLPLSRAVSLYAREPLQFEPGSQWLYSTVGIDILGRIVEVVSGMKYEEFLSRRIFEPLGMADSYIFLPESKRPRLAAVYTLQDGKMVKAMANIMGGDPYAFRDGAVYSGPGFAMYSTAADLANFYQMMLDKGIFRGRRLLAQTSVQMMSMVQTGDLKAGRQLGDGFGLTWEITKDPIGMLWGLNKGAFHHSGAFGTFGYVDPAADLIGIYLTQWDGPNANLPWETFTTVAAASLIN
jgi:CubicO group peptidase (beta-lactamase class C family)